MTKVEALRVLKFFPRYGEAGTWKVDGPELIVNIPVLEESKSLERQVRARMADGCRPSGRVEWLDVAKHPEIISIHRRVTFRRVEFYIRNFEKCRMWSGDRFVCLVSYKGHKVLWNGHHRTLAARLLNRKLRVVTFDLDCAEARANYAKSHVPSKRTRPTKAEWRKAFSDGDSE